MHRLRAFALIVTMCVSASAGAAAVEQAAATPGGAAPSQPPSADSAAPNQPPSADGATAPYTYQADGRRDPFQSLTATTTDDKAPRPTAAGIAGIRIDELSVRGVMRSRDRMVAMVTGPDNRTYVVHQGDKLADGIVKNINPQGLVLVQNVDDPRAKEKTREVRKLLRSEDEKE
jgi:Tfp pilus assembly protein PilP